MPDSRYEDFTRAGAAQLIADLVIAGTCLTPVPVCAGDSVKADFGEFGVLEAGFR